MASGKSLEIKTRIRSIEGTRKITKAMGLLASSKVVREKKRIQKSRPYFQIMYDTLNDIVASNSEMHSPFLVESTSDTACLIVMGGDRGLAGGYNGNIIRKAGAAAQGKKTIVLPIGKKTLEHFERSGASILSRAYSVAAEMDVGLCFEISRRLCDMFLAGEIGEVILVYTNFVSLLEQSPAALRVLPLSTHREDSANDPKQLMLYEPDIEEVYNAIVPEYLAGLIYGALCESQASEQGARHTAMDMATKNAGEILDSLVLQFNRARQGAITQEIIEIIAGAGE